MPLIKWICLTANTLLCQIIWVHHNIHNINKPKQPVRCIHKINPLNRHNSSTIWVKINIGNRRAVLAKALTRSKPVGHASLLPDVTYFSFPYLMAPRYPIYISIVSLSLSYFTSPLNPLSSNNGGSSLPCSSSFSSSPCLVQLYTFLAIHTSVRDIWMEDISLYPLLLLTNYP